MTISIFKNKKKNAFENIIYSNFHLSLILFDFMSICKFICHKPPNHYNKIECKTDLKVLL